MRAVLRSVISGIEIKITQCRTRVPCIKKLYYRSRVFANGSNFTLVIQDSLPGYPL